jgi:hypothetical protein
MLLSIIAQKPNALKATLASVGAYEHFDWSTGDTGILKGSTLTEGTATVSDVALANSMDAKSTNYADYVYMTEAITGFSSGVDISYWAWVANYGRTGDVPFLTLNNNGAANWNSSYAGLGQETTGGATYLGVCRGTGAGLSLVRTDTTYDLESEATSGTTGAFISASYDYSTRQMAIYVNGVILSTDTNSGDPAFTSDARFTIFGKTLPSCVDYDSAHTGFGLTTMTAAQHLSLYNAVINA